MPVIQITDPPLARSAWRPACQARYPVPAHGRSRNACGRVLSIRPGFGRHLLGSRCVRNWVAATISQVPWRWCFAVLVLVPGVRKVPGSVSEIWGQGGRLGLLRLWRVNLVI
jgi:hypothetical protein